MTAKSLRQMASVLANKAFVRYWLHWNYPAQDPWLMAIAAINYDGTDANFYTPDLGEPFGIEERGGINYYIFERDDLPERTA